MKRLMCVLLTLAFLIGISTYEVISIKNVTTKLDTEITNLVEVYDNNRSDITGLYDDVKSVKVWWESIEDAVCLMFNHKDLNYISDSLTKLTTYTKENDFDNAFAEINLLKEYTNKCQHFMGFNLHNVL